jgi:tetratricopeptide (TPR) repeat protein
MSENQTKVAPQDDFGPEVLLIFVGHSSDTDPEIEMIKGMEGGLQDELEAFLKAAPNSFSFKRLKIWEWNYDAPRKTGGQAGVISPYLHFASIAIFLFKERIGAVTWDELLECRGRKDRSVPILVLFPTQPDAAKMGDLAAVRAWTELLEKRAELTKDWAEPDSKSITPIKSYSNAEELRVRVFDEVRRALPDVLKNTHIYPNFVPFGEKPPTFLGEPSEFGFDRTPVTAHTWDQLNRDQIDSFLSTKLSLEAATRAGQRSPAAIDHLKLLGLLQDNYPLLGTFLCFAPKTLIEGKFDSCSLQMVRYDGTNKADSNADIAPISGNLLNLFDEGLSWLRSRSGLKRSGVIGSVRRDDLEIPESALREALANALVHRDYENPLNRQQPTRIEVFEDKVVITSYGALPTGISLTTLNEDPERVAPVRRNPTIAKIFNYLTHVELNASGVSRMLRETKRAALPAPRIISDDTTVRVEFIRRSPEALETLRQEVRTEKPTNLSKPARSAYISSTALDLPEHRKQAFDATVRQGLFPVMMEHLPALDSDAISISREMVDQSDIFIGIYGHRYGYVPTENNPDQISIPEIEYNWAVERGIPRMIFVMDEKHPTTLADVEKGEGGVKLEAFLERVKRENVFISFRSPDALRAEVINSIARYKEARVRERTEETESKDVKAGAVDFHYTGGLPEPPEKYIAHPYTLLQTHKLIGRQNELTLLTNWVSDPKSEVYRARIVNIVAIGGTGKSALTWKWFNDIAPHEMKPLAGRVWWSFHEADATFENFVIRALAYVSKRSINEARQIPTPDRETQLLNILDNEPYLIVLDGVERLLTAYARMDAAYLANSDYDQRTANYVANAYGLPANAAQSFTGEHRLRKTADPRAGAFLKRLSQVQASRILISTRLYPFDLQRIDGPPMHGCFAMFLPGLSNDDALNLWRSFGVSGAQDQLIALFNSFGNHALLVQALASEVIKFRPAPGDFGRWREANPQFDPANYPRVQDAMGHVLEYALRGLSDSERRVLQTIAGFRMPTSYETLSAVIPWANAGDLDRVLTELEDRGLVGWDKRANRYDLHPIVRGVVWSGLGTDARQSIYTNLLAHFEAVPLLKNRHDVKTLEDLTPAIELFYTLVGMGRYEDAYIVFREGLSNVTLYRLNANRQRVEMLEMLFPDGIDKLPRLTSISAQDYTLTSLATAYHSSGLPGRAIPLYRRVNEIDSNASNNENLGNGLRNMANALRTAGSLRESELAAAQALVITRGLNQPFAEGLSLRELGLTFLARGVARPSERALRRARQLFSHQFHKKGEGKSYADLAQWAIRTGAYLDAVQFANRAWELAPVQRLEDQFIRAARLQGESVLGMDNLVNADERLLHALARARTVNLVEEELPTLTALAELRRRQGDEKAARELLDDVWEYAERGPYPLLHADALNVLAQIERDAGNRDKAVEAATKAYELAWCDGPPYAYHWGLIKAKRHLEELGAPLPDMPPFDESKFEPMPDVEIDPDDEFHVGDAAD